MLLPDVILNTHKVGMHHFPPSANDDPTKKPQRSPPPQQQLLPASRPAIAGAVRARPKNLLANARSPTPPAAAAVSATSAAGLLASPVGASSPAAAALGAKTARASLAVGTPPGMKGVSKRLSMRGGGPRDVGANDAAAFVPLSPLEGKLAAIDLYRRAPPPGTPSTNTAPPSQGTLLKGAPSAPNGGSNRPAPVVKRAPAVKAAQPELDAVNFREFLIFSCDF